MVKSKQRWLVTATLDKDSTPPSGLMDPRNYENVDLHEEDGWVLVKKQRINIIIPPLSVIKESIMPGKHDSQIGQIPNPKQSQDQSIPKRTVEIRSQAHSEQEKMTISLAPRKDTQNIKTIASYRKFLGASKVNERPRLIHGSSDGSLLINQRIRASNIERKLQRAGGLSRWLVSLGLDQFVRVFRGKGLNKFQLVNLTMEKLKDMGAVAVGPRRKLMHAIDCLCQPYCFVRHVSEMGNFGKYDNSREEIEQV